MSVVLFEKLYEVNAHGKNNVSGTRQPAINIR